MFFFLLKIASFVVFIEKEKEIAKELVCFEQPSPLILKLILCQLSH